ncbi:MAG TPA: AraC family transcriptional regulator ligand-binding domain-containing protein [Aquabacterium sp.]|nr:AraC family transcriptional regulator ligand-binding domain-containing protein [Aquabacterium sp.]HRH27635.1 AraC family transcriptional regulator ligand-binding domain-containing protein [Aquabacterium sp.]
MVTVHLPDRWLQPSLHPVYVRLLCAELRRRGFSEAEIVQGTRLSWHDLHASNLFLSLEQVRRVVLRALALSACPWLGLVVGQSTQLAAHGAPGYAAMAARDVGQVLMVMQRFVALRQRVAHFEVQTEGGLALLLREDLMVDEVREYLMGHITGALVGLLETITGQDLRSRVTVHWPFEEPACAQAYREFLPHSIFGAPALRIELPVDLLSCPSLAPDAEAYRVAWRDCERLLTQQEKGSVTVRVQQRLVACEGQYPTLEQMAEIEHVSARTLIRYLREEGATYQQLLDGVREELACWLLVQTPLSVEAIAERLGYQDTSNFSRTFRRWLGMTPREFRGSTGSLQGSD